MSRSPIAIPWRGTWVPHATLEVGRGCNIHCRACYNTSPPHAKPLPQLEAELVALLGLRRLHTVTLTGGEPTLHPRLPEIVSLVKRRGLRAVLITNGLGLSEDLLAHLARAGADMVLLHVDRGQARPDLPLDPSLAEVQSLRAGLAERVASHGISVGLETTLYASHLPELPALVEEVFRSPVLDYLLVTDCCDFQSLGRMRGSVGGRMFQSCPGQADAGLSAEVVQNNQVECLLQSRLGLEPQLFIPSSGDGTGRRWLSYSSGILTNADQTTRRLDLRPTWFEHTLFASMRLLYGRYVFYHRDKPPGSWLRVLSNALAGSQWSEAAELVGAGLRPGTRLALKHLVFQESPRLEADGSISTCMDCPDATVREGTLVPVCLADRWEFGEGEHHEG